MPKNLLKNGAVQIRQSHMAGSVHTVLSLSLSFSPPPPPSLSLFPPLSLSFFLLLSHTLSFFLLLSHTLSLFHPPMLHEYCGICILAMEMLLMSIYFSQKYSKTNKKKVKCCRMYVSILWVHPPPPPPPPRRA